MKLGRPRCYTLFSKQHQAHHPHPSNGGGNLNFLSINLGRAYHRHMLQGFILIMVFCTVLLFQISLMSIPTWSTATGISSSSSSSRGGFRDDSLTLDNNNIDGVGGKVLRSCEDCDDDNNGEKTNVDMNNNNAIPLNVPAIDKDWPNSIPDFAPETSGANYNYLYDPDNETSGGGGGLQETTNEPKETLADYAEVKQVPNSSNTGRRRERLKEKVHYQKRKKLLDSLFLSVKTTKRFHSNRLEPILKTWFNLAREQTWIFTDADDPVLQRRTNGHMINTHCPSTHYRQALCCKMSAEFDTFIQSKKSWFCHFDDDNYVNVPALLDRLSQHNPKEYWYLGKPSLKSPIHFIDPDNKSEEVSFWFGTGGAGFCLSRALALRMSPLASGGKFTKLCEKIQLPDDVTIGYVAGHLLGQNLTVIPQLHSHFETMKFVDMKNPQSEITFSYVRYPDHVNILDVKGYFTEEEDPTRFMSLHCKLFPNFSFCPKGSSKR